MALDINRLVVGLEKVVRERTGPGLIFVNRKRLAKDLASELQRRLGLEVAWVTADMAVSLRLALVDRMRRGELRLAVCTSTWATGVDIPALQYVVLTGPDKAPIMALQEIGRALRVAGEKEFEVVNLIEPGLERNAGERARIMEDVGIQRDASVLDELANEQMPEVTWGKVAEHYGFWRYLILVGLAAGVIDIIKLLCS